MQVMAGQGIVAASPGNAFLDQHAGVTVTTLNPNP